MQLNMDSAAGVAALIYLESFVISDRYSYNLQRSINAR